MMSRPVTYVVILGLLASSLLLGQAESGTIVGTVTDQAGAVIPGVNVTLVQDATQFTRTVTTNASGQYVASSFPTGMITISVEHPGFQRLVRTGVQLTAVDVLSVDLRLDVGNVQQTIEVNSEAPLLQSQSATVSSLVTNQQISEMPLNGRTFTQLLPLSSGASPSNPDMSNSTGAYGGPRSNVNVSVNGSMANNNSYLIDGMTDRDMWVNYMVIVPSVDAIQEVRVLSSNYTAEFGAAAGAMTVVQTKGGTNDFHGSAYEFLRNDKMDANTFFNNRAGVEKPPFRQNQFGATFGGPIRSGKTFFFGDYQGTRSRQPATRVQTIPSMLQRVQVTTGDFSALSKQLYDPYTTIGSGDNVTRVPYPNNIIPSTELDPVAAKLMTLLPIPTSDSATRNFIFNPVSRANDDQFDIRIDQNVGSADRLFFKYSYMGHDGVSAGNLPPGPNAIIPVGEFVTGGSEQDLGNWSATLNFTKVIGTNIVNETRFGVVRPRYDDTYSSTGPLAEMLGVPGINISDRTGGLPGYSISGYQTIGQTGQFPDSNHTTSWQYENITTIQKGSHSIKFGGRYIRHQFNGFTVQAARGSYTFNGQFTRQIGAGGGVSLADFALGAFQVATRSVQEGVFGLRMWESGIFAEDSWRVNNRFTITYGMRHEMQSPPYEVNDRWVNFDVDTVSFRQAGVNGNSRTLRDLDTNNFAPRLGITYMLTADGKTVLRTGAGFFYVESFNTGKQLHQNPPMTISQTFTTDQNGVPAFTIKDGLTLPEPPDITDQASLNGFAVEFDKHMKLTKSIQWSFGIQRELMPSVLLDVSYVGSRGIGLINSLNGNQPVPGPGAFNPRRPFYSVAPLLGDVDLRTNYGGSKYHSLQVNLRKRYSKGLTGNIAWTWSHSLANTRGPAFSTRPQNSYCSACEWGNTGEDRRHMVVINHVYELPFGNGRQYVTDGSLSHIIGNWNVSGVWTMYTGSWFSPSTSGGVSNAVASSGTVSATERPDVVGSPNLPVSERTIDRWYDKTAFAIAQQYTFGNSGTSVLEGPGHFNVDLGVHRDFRFGEHARLTYRWEMFNAFNRANFTNPGSNISSSSAGVISGTRAARIMQMALKLTF